MTMAELAQAQSILKETLDKVATLEAQFDEANSKKVRNDADIVCASYSRAQEQSTSNLKSRKSAT